MYHFVRRIGRSQRLHGDWRGSGWTGDATVHWDGGPGARTAAQGTEESGQTRDDARGVRGRSVWVWTGPTAALARLSLRGGRGEQDRAPSRGAHQDRSAR